MACLVCAGEAVSHVSRVAPDPLSEWLNSFASLLSGGLGLSPVQLELAAFAVVCVWCGVVVVAACICAIAVASDG